MYDLFLEEFSGKFRDLQLNENNARHCTQVLRMQQGEKISLTNGRGEVCDVVISSISKKETYVEMLSYTIHPPPKKVFAIGMALLKNTTRFEWFLEKAVELGIREIFPLISKRTEKQFFREERMQGITASAMVQSKQVWLPKLHPPTKFEQLIGLKTYESKCIANCFDTERTPIHDLLKANVNQVLVLIGPEGDFTENELDAAKKEGFTSISLGMNRLRTETAGIYAASCIYQKFYGA